MIRLTESQYRKLNGAMVRRPHPMKSRVKSRLKEADVTKQCVQLMEAHGWKAIRLQRGLMRRRDGSVAMTIGEKGMCDWLFLRTQWSVQATGSALVFMAEFKGEGKKPSAAQIKFMAEMRARGLVAEWFDKYVNFAGFVRLSFGVK
jgi:hypothetical protein